MTLDALRSVISDALSDQRDVSILLPSLGAFALGGAEIQCNAPNHLEIRSVGGFTLDGEGRSRIFDLTNGCSLSLDGIANINGNAATEVRCSDTSHTLECLSDGVCGGKDASARL